MTIYYVCPVNHQVPTGGVKKIYDHVDMLNESGFDAAVVQGVRGFRPSWFANETRVVSPPFTVSSADVLVFPEILGSILTSAVPGAHRVSLNQAVYNTFVAVPENESGHPYSVSANLLGAIVVSEDSRDYVRYGWPDVPVHWVRHGIDPNVWRAGSGPRRREIVYLPRKRHAVSRQVIGLMRERGVLAGWDVTALDGLEHREVAVILRRAALYLHVSDLEGFGMPVLEALSSGCHVMGFTGMGGRELFGADHAIRVPENDVLALAETLEQWLLDHGSGDVAPNLAGADFARREYPPHRERESLVAAWEALLPPPEATPRTVGVLRPEDTWGPHDRPRSRARRAAGAMRVAGHILTGRGDPGRPR